MKALNRKKKPKHHSKVKYEIFPRGKNIASKVRECKGKKNKDCKFLPKEFQLILLTTNIKTRKFKTVPKKTYQKKY